MKHYNVKDNETFIGLFKLETEIRNAYDEFFSLEKAGDAHLEDYQEVKKRIRSIKNDTIEKYNTILNDRELHIDIVYFISSVSPLTLDAQSETGLIPQFNRFWRIAKIMGPAYELKYGSGSGSGPYDDDEDSDEYEEKLAELVEEEIEYKNHYFSAYNALDEEIEKRVLLNLKDAISKTDESDSNIIRAEAIYKILYYNYSLEDAFLADKNIAHWDFVEEFYDKNIIEFAGEIFYPAENSQMIEEAFLEKLERVLEESLILSDSPEIEIISSAYLEALYDYENDLADIHLRGIIKGEQNPEMKKEIKKLRKRLANSVASKYII